VLTQIDLQHFKCFRRLKLPLGKLTLLSGTNASGKSTILQALVLLHQTCVAHEWSNRLQLNGSEISLGTFRDVIDKVYGKSEFHFELHADTLRVAWTFSGDRQASDMSAAVAIARVNTSVWPSPERLRYLLPEQETAATPLINCLRNLTYLTAERVGPRDFYELHDVNAIPSVGPRGEKAVGLLHLKRQQPVLSSLVLESSPGLLLQQVEARMRVFFPDSSLDVQPVQHTNLVTLALGTTKSNDFHRPINVGFGLTQVLPIVVAALSATKGDLLLIENPEVHLHPRGQAIMGQFLAEVANAGVQILVESHSDHVLNGIRRAVKSGCVSSDKVALHFFRPRDENPELIEQDLAQVVSPTLDQRGNIDHWPEGFFDQYDKDLNYFAGWGN
jgi:predicted ATPase